MSRENGRRKRTSFGQIALLCMLVPAVYVAFQLYHVTRDTYDFETAINYTMSDSIESDGFVLLDGTAVEGSGDLGYLVQDGEKVSAGKQLAEVYTEEDQAGVRTQLDHLNMQISLLQKSQNTSSTQVDVLISQRSTAIYDLLESMDRHDTSNLEQTRESYLLAQNKLQITTGQASDFTTQINDLTVQRDALAEQLSALQSVSAPISGYFVSSSSMSPLSTPAADILAMSAGDIKHLIKKGDAASTDGLVGMIVPSYTWTYCGICTERQAAKFEGKSTVSISFPGKAETKLPAEVISVEIDEDSGLCKFVLQSEYINADILKLGQETAQIDFTSYSGLRISSAAVHLVMADTVSSGIAYSAAAPDSDSTEGQPNVVSDYVTGVYIKYGNLARFRRIKILYQDPDGEYVLAEPNGAVGTENEVRLYDEIIISGTNLYDGKLL